MPGRSYSATTGYRYGFNGKENDNEVKGEGNSHDFGARIYDPRLGRWLSVDRYTRLYPSISPYAFSGNDPIDFLDKDGNFITDKEGRVVYKLTGEKGVDATIGKDGRRYLYKYVNVKLLTENGVEVEAKKVTEARVKVNGKYQILKDSKRINSNCHGLTFAKGSFIIDGDDQVAKIIKNDNYKFVGTTDNKTGNVVLAASPGSNSSTELEQGNVNDASIWHSAKRNPENSDMFDQKDNIEPRETVNAEGVRNYNKTAQNLGDGLELLYFKKDQNKDGKKVAVKGNGVKDQTSIEVSNTEFEKIQSDASGKK